MWPRLVFADAPPVFAIFLAFSGRRRKAPCSRWRSPLVEAGHEAKMQRERKSPSHRRSKKKQLTRHDPSSPTVLWCSPSCLPPLAADERLQTSRRHWRSHPYGNEHKSRCTLGLRHPRNSRSRRSQTHSIIGSFHYFFFSVSFFQNNSFIN